MKLLLTGATGFLGGAIAAERVARGQADQTVFLVRAPDREQGAQRINAQLARFGIAQPRIVADQVLCGNLADAATLPGPAELAGVTHVLHAAALATFSNNPSIHATNVEGSLALARAAVEGGSLMRWLQVGTAMCCGPGLRSPVRESWDAGTTAESHLVPYTRSKLEAELALRALLGPAFVAARPSIVVGHSELGCAPSPSIFWVFRTAFALERFTCEPQERIDVVPADWCARALLQLLLKDRLAHDLYHVSAGDRACSFAEIDEAYASVRGTPAIAPRYRRVPVERLRELVPLFEERLGRVNRLLILRALTLYGAFAELNYVFDNGRLLAEGVPPPPRFTAYLRQCVRTTDDIPLAQQMAHDFK